METSLLFETDGEHYGKPQPTKMQFVELGSNTDIQNNSLTLGYWKQWGRSCGMTVRAKGSDCLLWDCDA